MSVSKVRGITFGNNQLGILFSQNPHVSYQCKHYWKQAGAELSQPSSVKLKVKVDALIEVNSWSCS